MGRVGEALAQKSNVLALTLDSLVQGVLNVDAQGRCTAWNSRFLELLQFPPDLMATRPLLSDLLQWQLAHNEFGDQLERMDDEARARVTRAMQAAPANFGHRYRRTRADGTVLSDPLPAGASAMQWVCGVALNGALASVATAFPSGQSPLPVKLDDVRRAVGFGGDDADRSMDALRQAILQALMDSGQLTPEMLKVLRGEGVYTTIA